MSKKNRNNNRNNQNFVPRQFDPSKLEEEPAIMVADIKLDKDRTADEYEEAEQLQDYSKAVFKPDSLNFNAFGITPVVVTYHILVSELKQMFLDICRKEIDDIEAITISRDSNTGDIQFYAVFKENSHHFVDDSLKGTYLENHRSNYFSKEVLKFAEKFGMKPYYDCVHSKDNPIIRNIKNLNKDTRINPKSQFVIPKNSRHNISMNLSWSTLVDLIFDRSGNGYRNQYKGNVAPCKLEFHWEYFKSEDSKFDRPRYLEVTKYKYTGSVRKTIMPFNYDPIG